MMTIVTSISWALILCQELCWSQNIKYFLSLLSFPIEENWDSDFKWFFWAIFLYFVHIKSTDLNSVSLWLQNPHESVSPASKTLTTYEGKETEDAGIWGWASGQHLVHIRYFTWVQVYTGLLWWLSWQRIHLQCRGPQFNSWVGKIPWRRDRLPLQCSWVSLVAQTVKNLSEMLETWVWSLGWEDPLEEGNSLQYSCLENPHGWRSLVGYSP